MRAVKDKRGKSVVQVLQFIFKEGRQPTKFLVDNGREFYNSEVKRLAKPYSTNNEEKSFNS